MSASLMFRASACGIVAATLLSCGEPGAPPSPPTIEITPTTLTFSAVQGSQDPPGQAINTTNSGGGTLTWTATSDQSWVMLSPATGTAPSSIMVTPSIAGMTAGNHSTTITISAAGATNTPRTVAVNLALAPPPSIGLSASSFTFSGQQGAANPGNQTLDITNTGGGVLTWTATDDAAWLTLTPSSGNGAATVTLSVNTGGLAAGTYTGTITVTAPGAVNTPRTATVTLTVTPPPSIQLSATSFTFSAPSGANPPDQTLGISNGGGGTLAWSVADDATWLTVSPSTGTEAGNVTLSVNSAAMAAGTYNGVITVSAAGASNTPRTATVTLTVAPNYDGAWSGRTAQDSTVAFQVTGGGITSLTFGFHATGSSCIVSGRTTTTFNTPVPITNGSFSRSVSGSPVSYTIGGNFSSGSAASGTLAVTFQSSTCSASVNTTWTAAK